MPYLFTKVTTFMLCLYLHQEILTSFRGVATLWAEKLCINMCTELLFLSMKLIKTLNKF